MARLTFGVALDFGSQLRTLQAQLERQSELLEYAEAAGFEIVAAGESASAGSFHLPDALLVLAAIAQRTRMRLCTGIALLPAWPVWRLALSAAELDQLSGGRLVLGIGLGTTALQQRAGWPADAVGQTVDETLEALRRLWSGASEYTGKYVRVAGALPVRPVDSAGVPIWVGGGIRRSAVRAARLGNGWYAGVTYSLDALPAQTHAYRTALGGANAAIGVVAVNRVTLVTESAAEEEVERYLASTLMAYAPPGQSVQQVADSVALVGTPDQVRARLESYRAAGVTHVLCRLSMDDTPPEVARTTIQLLGREVIPHFAS
jgi:alkanesulfonate monooxygenase SsuD/methylene tetrahydromethanopterin reductase-like flavin-dependent oxidoreductase (luciferase family)